MAVVARESRRARAPSPDSAARERTARAAVDVAIKRSSSAGLAMASCKDEDAMAREVDRRQRESQLPGCVAPTGASSLRGSSRFR
eukprot:9145206-Alexandrium_andersonii.AAC.1